MTATCTRKDFPVLLTNARRAEPLARHSTFRVGGRADYFFAPRSVTELVATVESCRRTGQRFVVVGAGSNLLFADEGFAGAVITTCRLRGIADVRDGGFEAAAGEPLAEVVAHAESRGSRALSFLVGIPGTVGGAVAMNAGIRGRTVGDLVRSVLVLERDGTIRRVSREALDFGYRTSRVRGDGGVILSVALESSGEAFDGAALLAYRRRTQPMALPSAGCVFRNPQGASAGELIERAGLKGFTLGKAQVSDKHANFIVNLGGATSAEICKLIDIVRQKVYNTSHISLDLEIEVIDG